MIILPDIFYNVYATVKICQEPPVIDWWNDTLGHTDCAVLEHVRNFPDAKNTLAFRPPVPNW
jgi:hypothetical protein